MRPIRDIDEEENFRIERRGGFNVIKRDPVKPEPEGTIVLLPFRITGYDPDCDGSLMARLENLFKSGGKLVPSGWDTDSVGLDSGLVVTEAELLKLLGDG